MSRRPFVIAITGGIGSGKSTVSKKFMARGFKVYNTDEKARLLQETDLKLIQQMQALLGDECFSANSMDRQMVAQKVFKDKNLLQELSNLVHPAVKLDFSQWLLEKTTEKIVIMECAVLFEGGFDTLADWVIVVTADEEIRIERVMKRDQLNQEQVLARINNQKPQEELIQKSNYNIDTNSGEEFIDAQIDDILNIIPQPL